MVHSYGAKLFCQLHPAKIQAGRGAEVKSVDTYDKELIQKLVKSYAAGAKRCMDWGVDGVEIHGGHAHEVAQFMSPYYNKREDEYGGDWRGRVRFSTEIVRAIKEACGPDFPLIFCISGSEMVEGGRGIEETGLMCQELVKAGADVIHVSCGMPVSDQYSCAPMDVEDCFNVDNAAYIKKLVDVPVVAVDRIVTLEEAEEVLQSKKADLIAMARPLLADPELVNKYAGTNPEPYCLCLGCNQGCRDDKRYKAIRCLQNPLMGRESTLRYSEASEPLKRKKILIAGAGPAGLEAACVLVRRGLTPVIVDKASRPGGLMGISSVPPCKANMNRVTDHRVAFLEQHGVAIRYGVAADQALIDQEKPDIVIAATGSVPAVPPIKGIDGPGVYLADDILGGTRIKGTKVAVLGAGLVGAETAEYLSSQGKQVEVFDMIDDIAPDFNKARRWFLLKRLQECGVKKHMNVKLTEVHLPSIKVENEDKETEEFTGFDALVIAAGRKECSGFAHMMAEQYPQTELHVIGDARKADTAIEAIADAAIMAAALS